MNDKTNKLKDNVNVTMHKVTISDKDLSYAKVQRMTAYIGNVIDKAMEKEKLMSRETLLYSAGVLRNAFLDLLREGKAIEVLELGTMYLKPIGSMETLSPDITDVPKMTVGFTPSELALTAVKEVVVAADVSTTKNPSLDELYNVTTLSSSSSVASGNSIRISGKHLKIAGEENKVGVFFAPSKEDGTYTADGSDWICVAETSLVDNTNTKLLLNVPTEIPAGDYRLIVRTAYGSGTRINKTIRTGIYDNIVSVTA